MWASGSPGLGGDPTHSKQQSFPDSQLLVAGCGILPISLCPLCAPALAFPHACPPDPSLMSLSLTLPLLSNRHVYTELQAWPMLLSIHFRFPNPYCAHTALGRGIIIPNFWITALRGKGPQSRSCSQYEANGCPLAPLSFSPDLPPLPDTGFPLSCEPPCLLSHSLAQGQGVKICRCFP